MSKKWNFIYNITTKNKKKLKSKIELKIKLHI
jgi:hypothetical protein